MGWEECAGSVNKSRRSFSQIISTCQESRWPWVLALPTIAARFLLPENTLFMMDFVYLTGEIKYSVQMKAKLLFPLLLLGTRLVWPWVNVISLWQWRMETELQALLLSSKLIQSKLFSSDPTDYRGGNLGSASPRSCPVIKAKL